MSKENILLFCYLIISLFVVTIFWALRTVMSIAHDMNNAAFTLNGFDDQERNLMFVKTD